MERLEIRYSRSRVLKIIGALVPVLPVLYFLTREDAWWSHGRLALGLGLGAVLMLLYRVIDSRPWIVIDDSGIDDRRLGLGPVAWEDIEKAELVVSHGVPVVHLTIHRLEHYLSRASLMKRLMLRTLHKAGVAPLQVSAGLLETDALTIFDAIQECRGKSP